MTARRVSGGPGKAAPRWRWITIALAAAMAVVAVVGLIGLAAVGPDANRNLVAAPAPSPSTVTGERPADSFALFPAEEAPPDIVREVDADPAGSWPVRGCPAVPSDDARTATAEARKDEPAIDFVSGTEHGPDYERALAAAWYGDEVTAAAAYDAVMAEVGRCASAVGAELTAADAGRGAKSQVAVVATPAGTDTWDVSIYAVVQMADVVVLAGDHAVFFAGSIPAPADATTTLDQADRLLARMCEADAARC